MMPAIPLISSSFSMLLSPLKGMDHLDGSLDEDGDADHQGEIHSPPKS